MLAQGPEPRPWARESSFIPTMASSLLSNTRKPRDDTTFLLPYKKTEWRSAQPSGTVLSSQFLTTPRTLRPDMFSLHSHPTPHCLGPKDAACAPRVLGEHAVVAVRQ